MTPARGAACDEVGLTREDEDVSAYEQKRSRTILENRNVLRELGLEPLPADSHAVAPQKRQRIVYERTRASSRAQPWMIDRSYKEDGMSQRQCSRPSSRPAPVAGPDPSPQSTAEAAAAAEAEAAAEAAACELDSTQRSFVRRIYRTKVRRAPVPPRLLPLWLQRSSCRDLVGRCSCTYPRT